MKAARGFFAALRELTRPRPARMLVRPAPPPPPKIALALGGGFARGIAHAGVLDVFERNHIPIHCITGVSAGSIVAGAYASGATPDEIARAGCAMRFGDVARWTLGRMGFVVNERMKRFLEKLLKHYRFEQMKIPLGVLATDLCNGQTVNFRDQGDVFLPIRASCSYPGLFQPVRYEGRSLVDGAMSMEIPALLARQLGATHVVSVHLPALGADASPTNMFQVINRCFQIMQTQTEEAWRQQSDIIIAPEVRGMSWDSFGCGPAMIKAGQDAALAALPTIQSWFDAAQVSLIPATVQVLTNGVQKPAPGEVLA
jgi:NTE family protein